MDAGSVRVEQINNRRWNLFGRFNYSPSQLITRIASLSTLQNQPADTTTFTLGVNGQLTTNVTNALRFNYSTQTVGQTWQLDSFGGAVPLSPRSLVPSPFSLSDSNAHFTAAAVGLPSLQVGTNASNSVSQWAVVDDVSILKGTHEIKVGVAYNRLQPTGIGQAFGPRYSIQSAQQLQQFTSNGTVSNFDNFVGNSWRIVFNELSGYAQDRWRSSERLTLTYGLRWEFNPPPSGQNTVLASWQNTNNPANLALAPVGTSIWKARYTDFAPRLGFAYRITPKGDFVLRGGTGVFYDLGTGIAPTLGSQFPNGAFFTDFSGSNSYPLPIANVGAVTPSFSLAPPYTGNMTGFSQGLRLPYSYQWNVAVEKSFGSSQSLSLTYLGQVGRRLIRQEILPTPNPNFATQFSLTENGDSSNYNALQVQYRRAMSRGLQVLLNYTWSHSIDTNSGDTIQPVSSSFAPVA